MIANYSICSACSELIDNSSGIWRDIDGHSFELSPTVDGGFVYHRHAPFTDENYGSLGKYDSLDAEILDSLALMGYATESLGDQATFGFYDFFPDYRAILTSHPNGSVTVTRFNDDETMLSAWNDIESEYANFDDEPCNCGSRNCDAFYDEYAYEDYDPYEV